MSILISSTELATFVSGQRDFFETFSSTHLLTIIKDPVKQIININDNSYNNYGPESNTSNYTLIPQSGQWRCMTYDENSWTDEDFSPIPNIILRGDLIIKVESDAKNYIDNGKTNFLIVDNENYVLEGGPLPKSYGNQDYFYYSLKKTT